MYRDALKDMLWQLPELVALTVLLQYSLKWSILLAVCLLMLVSFLQMHFMRKNARIVQVMNESRLYAIQEALNITDEMVQDVLTRKILPQMPVAERAALNKDWIDLMGQAGPPRNSEQRSRCQ